MAEWHLKSKRKKTGGIRKSKERSDKQLAWKGGFAAHTTVSKAEKKKVTKTRTLGGNEKRKVLEVAEVNLTIPKEKKNVKAKIVSVLENKANREFARRNVITKGALVKVLVNNKEVTAKVSSRPGQDGTVNAVLAEKKAA